MNEANRRVLSESYKNLGKVKNINALRRIGSGDFTPIDDVKDADERDRQGTDTRAAQRRREDQARRDKAREAASKHLAPRSTDHLADLTPPYNGKAPHF